MPINKINRDSNEFSSLTNDATKENIDANFNKLYDKINDIISYLENAEKRNLARFKFEPDQLIVYSSDKGFYTRKIGREDFSENFFEDAFKNLQNNDIKIPVENLEYGELTGEHIAPNTIKTDHLSPSFSLEQRLIPNNFFNNSSFFADGVVTSRALASNSVVSSKIAPASITTAHLSPEFLVPYKQIEGTVPNTFVLNEELNSVLLDGFSASFDPTKHKIFLHGMVRCELAQQAYDSQIDKVAALIEDKAQEIDWLEFSINNTIFKRGVDGFSVVSGIPSITSKTENNLSKIIASTELFIAISLDNFVLKDGSLGVLEIKQSTTLLAANTGLASYGARNSYFLFSGNVCKKGTVVQIQEM